jgi:glycosyltransferase involved in cell wall biosynthesis
MALLRKGTHRVAYFAPKPDAGSFRYRCYNTTQALNRHSSEVSASYFFLSDLAHISNLSDYADSLVVFRTPYDTDVHRVVSQFSRAGKSVFFDIDDLVFDVAFAPLVTSNLNYKLWGKDIDQWFAFIANIGATMKLSHHVITTNNFIADRVSDYSGLPVSVIPNFLNDEQLEVSEKIRARQKNATRVPGIALGYFSGSHSHTKDFAVASIAISNFLKSSPTSTLTVLGHLDLPTELEAVRSQVTRRPFMNFLELQHAIAAVDVNLVPLQLSPFTFSKSELKYFEAAAVETVTMATPTPLFASVIGDGVNGFLANTGQWERKLREFEMLEPDVRRGIARKAKVHSLAHYTPETIAPRLARLFVEGN